MAYAARESLGSRLGFIFLSAGCAIGLGNVWRFPFITGLHGGGAFVLLYLFFLAFLAMPIMVMEFAVGRASRQSVVGSFKVLQPAGAKWSLYGYVALAANYILMMFYTVVAGWMLAYFWYFMHGELAGLDTAGVGDFFGALLSDPAAMIGWLALVVIMGSLICSVGLRRGVERITKLMMGGLLVIMIALMFRSVTLDGGGEGLEFYLVPDFSRLEHSGIFSSIYAALGQAFFTLSIGIGSMAIFGSYIGRERSLFGEAAIITSLDTLVAFMAGLIIFPVCFAFGVKMDAGPGLIFVTLPNLFNHMALGRLWGTLFFLFMSFAAMTTVVAVFEHIVANFIDMFKWSRRKASLFHSVSMFVLSLPCVLGFNLWEDFHPLGGQSNILDLEDFIVSNNLLPLGAIVYLLFCCTRYGWGWFNFLNEANAGQGLQIPRIPVVRFYVTVFIPLAILAIFVAGYYEKFFA